MHAGKGIHHGLSVLEDRLHGFKVFAGCGQFRNGRDLGGERFAVSFLFCCVLTDCVFVFVTVCASHASHPKKGQKNESENLVQGVYGIQKYDIRDRKRGSAITTKQEDQPCIDCDCVSDADNEAVTWIRRHDRSSLDCCREDTPIPHLLLSSRA